MRALLDVNVLIALLDSDHSLHDRSTRWFAANARHGWASCPITQNGCVRIMTHPGYPNPLPVKAVVDRLREATEGSLHEFWPDDASIVDAKCVDATRIHGPRQITDGYLLALAVQRGGRFVTFDGRVSIAAVPLAQRTNLLAL
jgi:toxin-antitoxin system PIN domain toxin